MKLHPLILRRNNSVINLDFLKLLVSIVYNFKMSKHHLNQVTDRQHMLAEQLRVLEEKDKQQESILGVFQLDEKMKRLQIEKHQEDVRRGLEYESQTGEMRLKALASQALSFSDAEGLGDVPNAEKAAAMKELLKNWNEGRQSRVDSYLKDQ